MTLAHNLTLKNSVMKTYTKIYIGKGKKVANLDIIKVSFNLA